MARVDLDTQKLHVRKLAIAFVALLKQKNNAKRWVKQSVVLEVAKCVDHVNFQILKRHINVPLKHNVVL